MQKIISLFILLLLYGGIVLYPSQKVFAQSGIECMGCGGMNGNHKPDCKYISSGFVSKPYTKSSSFEQEIMGAIFSNMLNNLFDSSADTKKTDAEKLRNQQEEQLRQQRLAALISLQKKYNDSIAQVAHDKMMKDYKKLDDGGDLKYKGLDDRTWKASINFNCKIKSFKGDVIVYKSINGKLHAKQLNMDEPIDLAPGDWIRTGINSNVHLHYGFENGGEDIMLGQKSALNIITDEYGTHIPKFVKGNYYVTNNLVSQKAAELKEDLISKGEKQINQLKKKLNPIRLHGGTAGIRGTEFSIEVDSLGNSVVNVFEGVVEINDNNLIYLLKLNAGQKGIISKMGNISGPIAIKEKEILKWWKE